MQISLLNRFQGSLVGAVVANILGAYGQPEQQRRRLPSWLDYDHWPLGVLSPAAASEAWGSLWVHAVNNGIEAGGRPWSHFGQSCRAIELSHPAASAIALLPLILITHDQPIWQRQVLASSVRQAGWDGPALLAALIIAAGINPTLQNRLAPTRLPSRLNWVIKELKNPIEHQSDKGWADPKVLADALNLLQAIQPLIQQSIPLETAAEQLQQTSSCFSPLGLALYCFLSTPEDYGLTVARALGCCCQPQLVASLAGILAGAYNGLGSIPIAWRLGVQCGQSEPTAISSLWQISSESVLRRLSEVLLASWAGADQQIIQSSDFKHSLNTFEDCPS